eukprot:g10382.t1
MRIADAVAAARKGSSNPAKAVVLAVGPEGGWVDYEVGLFRQHGFIQVSLGRRILTTDVAIVQVYTWKALPLNELRGECHKQGISHHLDMERPEEEKHQELLERLLLRWADRWKEDGVPLHRFSNLRSAKHFAERVVQIVSRETGLQHELAAARP